jgi:hypothetical protein
MYNADWGYDPFQQTKNTAYWKLDKPTIVGESPGMAGKYTVKQMVDGAFANGYAGIMPWSYNAKDGYGTLEQCKVELKAFRDAHASLVDFSCGNVSAGRAAEKASHANLTGENGWVMAKIVDMRGKTVRVMRPGAQAVHNQQPRGIFIFQAMDARGRMVVSRKTVNLR